MTQATHTPGPWIIEEVDDGQAVISAESKKWIDFARVWVVTDGSTDKEGEANARLIAAAPELLEACLAMIEWDDREKDHAVSFENRIELCTQAFTKARAAIAKATGANND